MKKLTVLIPLQSIKYLDYTLDSLKNQKYKDFDIYLLNPHDKFNITRYNLPSIQTPYGINNQINTGVSKVKSERYAIVGDDCIIDSGWLYISNYYTSLDYVVGNVNLYSFNKHPEWLDKEEKYKLGFCDSKESANYRNFIFSLKAYEKHGGFNSNEDTLKYFINSSNGVHQKYKRFDIGRVVDFETEKTNELYKLDSELDVRYFKYTPTSDEPIKNTKKNLILSFCTSKESKEALTFTEDSVFKYAERVNADYICIENKTQTREEYEKFRTYDIAKNYDSILVLDPNILIHPQTIDVFSFDREDKVLIDNNGNIILLGKDNLSIFESNKEENYIRGGESKDIIDKNIEKNNFPYSLFCCFGFCDTSTMTFDKRIPFLHKETIASEQKLLDVKTSAQDIKKEKNICVLTVSNGFDEILDFTSKTHKEYAEKINADYHIINSNDNLDWPILDKFNIYSYLKEYDRVLYVDADIYIKRDSPNLFDIVPDNCVGLYNEIEDIQNTSFKNIVSHEFNYVKDILSKKCDLFKTYNCGVMLIPNIYSDIYKPPTVKVPNVWCFDQYYVYLNIYYNNIPVFDLDEKYNFSYMRENWIEKVVENYFLHLNSIKSKDKRIKILKQLDELFWKV